MSETGLQGNVFTTQAGNVYLKSAGAFSRYIWGGRRMRVDEIQDARGDVSTTTRFNPRGGVERDMLLQDIPGVVTTTLVMKHEQRDRMKSELASGFWNVDKRMHIGGADRDAPDKWEEIRRMMWGKATQRTDPASSWEAEEEGLVQLPWSALDAYDIYPVNYAETAGVVAHQIVDIKPGIFGSDVWTNNLLYAVSGNPTAGDPVLLVNERGGRLADWNEISLTGETLTPVAVQGIGDLVLILLGSKITRSDDRGQTLTDITYAPWATNALTQIDALDQGFILACGAGGFVYGSFDGGRTWETLESGGATSEDLARINISRTNPQVVWAIGANNALIKSENGANSWFSVTGPAPGENLLGVHVESPDSLLVLSAEGLVYETVDGGDSWIQQGALPGVAGASFARGDIIGTPADVYYLFLSDTTNGEFVMRNVEAGADGYWYPVGQSGGIAEGLYGLAVSDVNVAHLAGGTADTSSLLGIVA